MPEDQRIVVRGVDVFLSDYGGASDFRNMLQRLSGTLPDPGPIAGFLNRPYGTADAQRANLEQLDSDLATQRATLIAAWGEDRYDTVAEMVEVELASVEIRAIRGDDYDRSVRMREDVIKMLVDRYVGRTPGGTVINIGGNHAQKAYLKGTKQQWLGEYVAHESPVVNGSVIVLCVTAARIMAGGSVAYDILDASPAHELFRITAETFGDRGVFLPLDDPVFSTADVAMNFEAVVHTGAPKEVYDMFVQFPVAHRVPLP